ncbi:MAG: polysaccharide biosynthesis/export family protein [Crocinitomicaceae bacterium]|nr:polysaccharide biosynthesis/export family protein [Crocinitomicaceae bacterium]
MFKEAKGDKTYRDSIPMNPTTDYLISVDDKVSFQLYTNEGEILLTNNADVSQKSVGGGQSIEYLVRRDGSVELPKIGKVKIEGLSITECEDLFEDLYSKEYNNPFVQVQITNQRVVVFPGNGSDAKVINLVNNNTTLVEAIAQAGGITERGKAKKVKLMRRVGDKRVVYLIDLSTIDGLKYADMIVQANDYIYIEPNPQITKELIKEVAPVITILSSGIVVITVLRSLK